MARTKDDQIKREFESSPDGIDVVVGFFVLAMLVKYGPLAILPYGSLGLLQYRLRRSQWFYRLTLRYTWLNFLLSGTPVKLDPKPEKVEQKSFYTGVTTKLFAKDTLDTIPAQIAIHHIPDPQTTLAVPIGFGIDKDNERGRWIWADFGAHTIHALIAGQTGAGKDNLMRLWYMTLTKNNKPYEVKFAIIDGKGEWLLPDILSGEHMFIPPVGGIDLVRDEKGKWIDRANENIELAIEEIMNEVAHRTQLFQQNRVTSVERYREVTGLPLPYLIIFATDVGQNIKASENLNMLLNVMTSKGRSLGIRIVVSMQTTSKQDTFWRSNLSLIICGALQNDSQDSPVIGLPVDNIFYRPSRFPSPSQRPGLFYIRDGDRQYVVQSPYLPFDSFVKYTQTLPQKYVDPFLKNLL